MAVLTISTQDGEYEESDISGNNLYFEQTGIFPDKAYPQGIVTLTEDISGTYFEDGKPAPLYIVAYQIDDVAFILATKGKTEVGGNLLPDGSYYSLKEIGGENGWDRGFLAFTHHAEACMTITRITNLAKYYGLDINFVIRHLTK